MKALNQKIKENKRDYYRQLSRDYRQTDVFKEKDKNIYSKKRQEKKHIMYDLEWENCKKYFENKCAYCGLPIEEHFNPYKGEMKLFDFHKEHVIDEGKNDLRNCVPSCNMCNNTKKTKPLNSWYNPSNPNYTYERYLKIYQWIRYDHKKFILPKRRYKGQHMEARIQEVNIIKNKNNKS